MLTTERLSIPSSFEAKPGTKFRANLGDLNIHQMLVDPIHEAHRVAADVEKGASQMLRGLSTMGTRVNTAMDTAERVGASRPLRELLDEERSEVHADVVGGRQQMMAAMARMQELVARATVADFIASCALSVDSRAAERVASVALVPASKLPDALRDAVTQGDRSTMTAIYNRFTTDKSLSQDICDAMSNALGDAFSPLQEALRRIADSAHSVFCLAEFHADSLAAYPGFPSSDRMLQRANAWVTFPSLLGDDERFSGMAALERANEPAVIAPEHIVVEHEDPYDDMWSEA